MFHQEPIRPAVWKDPPSGFKFKPEDAVTVTFHALLPMQLWKWDERSEVYIRFGTSGLGLWECDCGPMKPVRYTVIIYSSLYDKLFICMFQISEMLVTIYYNWSVP